jgi:hypothetical protein
VASSRPASAFFVLVGACFAAGAAFGACSADEDDGSADDGTGTNSGGAGATSTGGQTSTSPGVGGFTPAGSGGGANCGSDPDSDFDEDGFTFNQGDCNDCDELVNPAAVEVIAEPDADGGVPAAADEDCDGMTDNIVSCDQGIELDEMDPEIAAKAMGICAFVDSATWVLADGSPPPTDATQLSNFHRGHGVQDHLGPNNVPQEGERMLMISSGSARREDQPGFIHRNFNKAYASNAPVGFPKESATCPGVTTGAARDATGLELEITAPSNAQGFKFDFNFFTFEWPAFICSTYNDFFVAILEPFPAMQTDGNISYDAGGNPISVNNAFLDICGCPSGPPCGAPPSNPKKQFDCGFGTTGVMGTDWDVDDGNVGWTNGSTGWLRTTAPVEPGQKFKIRFVTYDSGDSNVDSATLLDNWQWSAKPGSVVTVVPPPK